MGWSQFFLGSTKSSCPSMVWGWWCIKAAYLWLGDVNNTRLSQASHRPHPSGRLHTVTEGFSPLIQIVHYPPSSGARISDIRMLKIIFSRLHLRDRPWLNLCKIRMGASDKSSRIISISRSPISSFWFFYRHLNQVIANQTWLRLMTGVATMSLITEENIQFVKMCALEVNPAEDV